MDSGFVAKLAEVNDGGQMNVGSLVPLIRKLACLRHAAVGEKLPAHRPVSKIREAHNTALPRPRHFPNQKQGTMKNLNGIGQDHVIDRFIGIIRQSLVQISMRSEE